MKTARKVILAVLCVVCLVVASITGTLAYLTDTEVVTNTFTVGKVKMTMDEADVTEYGVKEQIENEGVMVDADRVTANEYKLIPGHTYTKDPIIHIEEGSESCYVFIKVQNDIEQIEDSTNTIASQITANSWNTLSGETGVYWKLWAKETDDRDLETFATFKIKGDIDNDTIDDYATTTDAATGAQSNLIKVTAYAIQADGMANEVGAWTVLQTQLNPPANP